MSNSLIRGWSVTNWLSRNRHSATASRSDGGSPRTPFEQLDRPNVVDHFPGHVLANRSQAEGHVAERLGVDAAQAEHQHRAKPLVTRHTQNDFLAALEHLLNDDAPDLHVVAHAAAHGIEHRGVGRAHGFLIRADPA